MDSDKKVAINMPMSTATLPTLSVPATLAEAVAAVLKDKSTYVSLVAVFPLLPYATVKATYIQYHFDTGYDAEGEFSVKDFVAGNYGNRDSYSHHFTGIADASKEGCAARKAKADRIAILAKAEREVNDAERLLDSTFPHLHKGCKAVAIKGRKVKVGTEVEVFWVGTVNNKFTGCREERAGVKVNGETVWCSADNLEVVPTEVQVDNILTAKAILKFAQKALEATKAALGVQVSDAT